MKMLKEFISFILLMAMMPVLLTLSMFMPIILIIRGIPGFLVSVGTGVKDWFVDLDDNPIGTIKDSIIGFIKIILYIIALVIFYPFISGIACSFGGSAYCGY